MPVQNYFFQLDDKITNPFVLLLGLLSPDISEHQVYLSPTFCNAPEYLTTDQMTSVANNAIYINEMLSHAETASRPLHLSFMSEQDATIYTITPKTIATFILGNELLAVLILSSFIALMLTMFGIWIQSTVIYQLYQRSKLVVAGNIARERHKKRIPNDTVTEVRLAEVQYNICFDLDFFSYVQLGTFAFDIALLATLLFLTLICRFQFSLLFTRTSSNTCT